MRLDWFQAPTEELKAVALLVNLHPLPIVLDLCVHSVGTLLDCLGNRATRLRLEVRYTMYVYNVISLCTNDCFTSEEIGCVQCSPHLFHLIRVSPMDDRAR